MRRVDVRLVSAVALAVGGGLGLSRYAARELLHRQAQHARRLIGQPLGESVPDADRVWKRSYGDPLHLVLLGDSIAAGLGADRRKETLGGRLARYLAKELRRSVRLTTLAVVGSESADLTAQVDRVQDDCPPDVAVIVVGGNDVTHRVPTATSVAHLEEAIARLRGAGAVVVVGTCPDLGALRPVPQPLRTLGSHASRALAAAQHRACLRSGAHPVSLARAVGPFFLTDPDGMFSLDRFHPSPLGYKRTAKEVLPAVVEAIATDAPWLLSPAGSRARPASSA
ncbi:SGNH/GDSL hydrolase family protein [Nocardioidaceae bacterium]|nr:SGNH/GDSL hydrolase family protein [Nocardioidaceae bacterium]